MLVLLTGSRDWAKRGPVLALMRGLAAEDSFELFVFGDCPTGLDAIALQTCKDLGYAYRQFDAEWGTYGKPAGPRRNGEMVAFCRGPGNVCFGFRTHGLSPGTDDCLKQANEVGLPCYVTRSIPPPT